MLIYNRERNPRYSWNLICFRGGVHFDVSITATYREYYRIFFVLILISFLISFCFFFNCKETLNLQLNRISFN